MKLSIIIPTLNEEKNIEEIITQLIKILNNNTYEILIVDDYSKDKTKQLVENLYTHNKKIKFLQKKKRSPDLSKSIMYGIQKSKGDTILVLDADLSHPVKKAKKMIDMISKEDYQIIVGCRKHVENWEFHRKIISKIGTILIRPVTKIEDPLSGFFIFKKEILKDIKLKPLGYKILIEILGRTQNIKIKELFYTFKTRKYGESKLNTKIMMLFIIQIIRIYMHIAIRKIKKIIT